MFTRKQNAESFFDKVNAKYQDKKLYNLAPKKALESYIDLLDEIATKRNYNEGDKIEAEDLERIVSSVKSIISATADKMVEKKDSITTRYFDQSESLPSLLLMNDYLFALAQKELGCPDMPANFGTDVEKRISEAAFETDFNMKRLTYNSSDSINRYNRQRKINADKLIEKNENLSERLDKNPTSIEIAEYAAEYQALKKRQENHNRVWRFFHKGENKKRNELLAQMKRTLKGALGASALIETATPEQLAKEYHARTIKENMAKESDPNGICRRCGNFDTSKIGHEPIENPDHNRVFDYLYNRPNEDLNKSLEEDLKEDKNTELSNKVKDEPKSKQLERNALSN